MTVLDQIAYFQERRDETPNQELARQLVEAQDRAGIQEIAENLWNKDTNVQSDCVKVLYEVGYLDPSLIAPYAGDFLKLLGSRHNRLVWGAMLALSTIVDLAADSIDPQHAEKTVIAVDAAHQAEFIHTLERRLPDMSAAQAARIRRVIKQAEKG